MTEWRSVDPFGRATGHYSVIPVQKHRDRALCEVSRWFRAEEPQVGYSLLRPIKTRHHCRAGSFERVQNSAIYRQPIAMGARTLLLLAYAFAVCAYALAAGNGVQNGELNLGKCTP